MRAIEAKQSKTKQNKAKQNKTKQKGCLIFRQEDKHRVNDALKIL